MEKLWLRLDIDSKCVNSTFERCTFLLRQDKIVMMKGGMTYGYC